LWGLHLFNQEHPLSNHHTTKPPNQVQSHFSTQEQKSAPFDKLKAAPFRLCSRQRPFGYAQGSASRLFSGQRISTLKSNHIFLLRNKKSPNHQITKPSN
jgi:hypothetical protein